MSNTKQTSYRLIGKKDYLILSLIPQLELGKTILLAGYREPTYVCDLLKKNGIETDATKTKDGFLLKVKRITT